MPLLLAVPSWAGEDAAANAEALFRAGREAAEAGDYDLACARFGASLAQEAAVGTRLNLALCEEQRGQLAAAWAHLHTVLEQLPAEDSRQPIAEAAKERVERALAWVTLTDESLGERFRVLVGGNPLDSGSFGVALPWNPGTHRVLITAPGHPPRTLEVTVRAGERLTVPLALGEVEVQAPPESSAPPVPAPSDVTATSVPEQDGGQRSRDPRRGVAYAALATGGVGLAVGSAAGIFALSQQRIVDRECGRDKQCSPAGMDAVDRGKTAAAVSTVGFVSGTVIAGVGLALVLHPRRASAREDVAWKVGLTPTSCSLSGQF